MKCGVCVNDKRWSAKRRNQELDIFIGHRVRKILKKGKIARVQFDAKNDILYINEAKK